MSQRNSQINEYISNNQTLNTFEDRNEINNIKSFPLRRSHTFKNYEIKNNN
jgi:hypothetical protein